MSDKNIRKNIPKFWPIAKGRSLASLPSLTDGVFEGFVSPLARAVEV